MIAVSTAHPLQPGAEAGVIQASATSVIQGLYAASQEVGDVAHRLDCIDLAHRVSPSMSRDPSSAAFSLSADLLDKALVQQVCDRSDLVTLCMVAADRMGLVEDNCERELRPVADAVATALLNIAGYVLLEQGRGFIQQLAEPLRVRAADCLDNYVWASPAEQEG